MHRELTKKVTDEDKKIMVYRQRIFASWMSERILQNNGSDAQSSLIIWPFNPQEPQYRDNYPPQVDPPKSRLRLTGFQINAARKLAVGYWLHRTSSRTSSGHCSEYVRSRSLHRLFFNRPSISNLESSSWTIPILVTCFRRDWISSCLRLCGRCARW